MENSVQNIVDILEQEEKLWLDLQRLIDQERQALTDMNVDMLMAISRGKAVLTEKLVKKEEALQAEAGALINAGPGENVKLEDLLLHVDDKNLAGKMSDRRSRLAAIRRRVLDENIINRKFAEDTLGYLNDGIAMIMRSGDNSDLYKRGNSRPQVHAGPAMISREV